MSFTAAQNLTNTFQNKDKPKYYGLGLGFSFLATRLCRLRFFWQVLAPGEGGAKGKDFITGSLKLLLGPQPLPVSLLDPM